ncbi:MAG: M15 family metallopeptidase, partial [Erythrobacter sp.]|nr:M15 family metallopeptidase [Erythrobacter sp.]
TPPTPPTPAAPVNVWPRQKDVLVYYGKPGANQTMLASPYPMKLAWDNSKVINKFSVHEKVHDSMARVLKRALDHYGLAEIQRLNLDQWGGCLNVRKMRGGNNYSMHSWGIAIDIDPSNNQLRWGSDRAHMARKDRLPFVKLWEEEGWLSLGRERNYDWMHFQAARL